MTSQTEGCDADVAITFSIISRGKHLKWLSSAVPGWRGDKLITASQTKGKEKLSSFASSASIYCDFFLLFLLEQSQKQK